MHRLKKVGFTVLISILAGVWAIGQEQTLSTYSRFGLGEIAPFVFERNLGMGGTGIGITKPNFINMANPAAIARQDTMSFIFDVGVKSRFIEYTTENQKQPYKTASFDHLAMSFPVNKYIKLSTGIMPYSSVNYNNTDTFAIPGSNDYNLTSANGSGGVSRIFLQGGVNLSSRLTAGVQVNYLFGTIKHMINEKTILNDTLSIANTSIFSPDIINYTRNIAFKGVYFGLGAQYTINSGNNKYSFGITGHPAQNVSTAYSFTTTSQNQLSVEADTLSNTSNNRKSLKMPGKIGIGASAIIGGKLMLALDYSTQFWSGFDYDGLESSNAQLVNSSSLRVGAELVPNPKALRNYLNHMMFRTGGYYNKTNLEINGEQITNKGISLGLGFPFRGSKTMFNMAYTFGVNGTTNSSLIKEKYHQFSVGFSFYDFWFRKMKYD